MLGMYGVFVKGRSFSFDDRVSCWFPVRVNGVPSRMPAFGGKLVYRSAVPHLGVFQYRVRGRSFSFGHNRSPCTQAVFAAGGAEWSSSLTVWRLLVCLGVPAPCRRHDRVHAESQAARECCWVLGRAKSRWNQGMAYSTSNTVSSMEHLLTKLAIRKTG